MCDRETAVVILAAGQGKRMKSDLPKVLHPLCGKPLIEWVISASNTLAPGKTVVVVGHGADKVKMALAGQPVLFALQKEQLGTAHAVMQALPVLENFQGDLLVLCGDVPLTSPETLSFMLKEHRASGNAITLLSVMMEDPTGYGRIIRSEAGQVIANVEHRDATDAQREIKEINGGIYLFDSGFLFSALKEVRSDNDQAEYYLPDVIAMAVSRGLKIGAVLATDDIELCGVNRPEDLERLEQRVREEGRVCRA